MANENNQDPWVIRTDFSNEVEWETVRELIAAPQMYGDQKFYAYVRYVSDEKFAGAQPENLVCSEQT
ncbi:MAG: hypothetical protein ACFB5Z_13005 [Elainellaceae cyanobacterium]